MGIINPKRLQCTLESCWRILSSNPKTSQRSYALSSRTKLLVLTKFRVEFWKNALQNLLVHYAVSSDSALQTVLSQTNGRLPLSSQFTREIPSLIQLSTGQFPCWASLARWWNLRSTSSFRITCSPISWSLADNLASDHIIAPPTFSPSLHRLGMHL